MPIVDKYISFCNILAVNSLDHVEIDLSNHGRGLADYPAGSRFGPRHCASYEFVWIIAGDVEWICNDSSFQLPQGSVCLCKPGDHDSFIWDPRKRTRHGSIHFNLSDTQQVLGPSAAWPQVLHCGREEFLIGFLNHVMHLAQADDSISQVLAVQGLKHALSCFIYQRALGIRVDTSIEEHPLIQAAMNYVHQQWAALGMHNPAVVEIAASIGISRGHLVRLFKQEIGLSPAQCIRNIRLDQAALMLARSDIRIQDIADDCGFENQFHFSRAFKQQYHISPRHYRDEIKAGKQQTHLVKAKIRQLSRNLFS